MRESNHNNPQQNRACVCITSQLYDRRALDAAVSSQPLVSSLTHLAYLTSTSPRIRETLTVDGGLERLTAIALAALERMARPHTASSSSLEEVVDAEAEGLKSDASVDPARPFRPFATYTQRRSNPASAAIAPAEGQSTINQPSARASATEEATHFRLLVVTYTLSLQSLVNVGVRGSEPVRTRCVEAGVLSVAEQILKGYFEEREAAQRSLWRRQTCPQRRDQDEDEDDDDAETATLRSPRQREHSAPASSTAEAHFQQQQQQQQAQQQPAASSSALPVVVAAPISISPSPLVAHDGPFPSSSASSSSSAPMLSNSLAPSAFSSRANTPEGIPSSSSSSISSSSMVADDAATASSDDGEAEQDERPPLSAAQRRARSATIKVDVGTRSSSSQQQQQPDPAATNQAQEMDLDVDVTDAEGAAAEQGDDTEMAVVAQSQPQPLLQHAALAMTPTPTLRPTTSRAHSPTGSPTAPNFDRGRLRESVSSSAPVPDGGLHFFFRDDDLLLCLQLLAYLSKYPHVRAAFHHPCIDFACGDPSFLETKLKGSKEKQPGLMDTLLPLYSVASPSQQQTSNIFSLVERYTVRPSVSDKDRSALPPPLRFSPDISYWAGVIMRNACRKDEHRNGIRQCANMACGSWESYPREFAKCRRCRKAKYCSKACQSKAWQGGHRYWCSARELEQQESHSHQRRSSRDASGPSSTPPRWPYQGSLAPLAHLPDSDAVALARYLEGHPELAQSFTAVSDLVQRYQARQRSMSTATEAASPAAPAAPPSTRPRANSLPGAASGPGTPGAPAAAAAGAARLDVAAPALLLRRTFQENEEDSLLEAQTDNMVHIADPGAEQQPNDLGRVQGAQDLAMV